METRNEMQEMSASTLPQAGWLTVGAVVTLVSWIVPLWLNMAEATQMIPVQALYAVRFVIVPVFWLVCFRQKVSDVFAAVIEHYGSTGRVIVSGVIAFVAIFTAATIFIRWPAVVRAVPTAESRGIVGRTSPSVILPVESAGIKATLRTSESQVDAFPSKPTKRPPQAPRPEVNDSVESSPVKPEATVPVTAPDAQSQTAPSNELPRPAPPNAPTSVRLVR